MGTTLAEALRDRGDDADVTRCGGDGPRVGAWAEENFHHCDALVFVGSAGIAVRAIAPFVADKTRDPAVLAVDEMATFAVSLLSGHIGGANALARRIAAITGAAPVITTATDVSGVFAVDTWAAENDLAIANPKLIKSVSARALAGETIQYWSAFPVAGGLPRGWEPYPERCDVRIDVTPPAEDGALVLLPRVLVLGIGCRENTGAETISSAFKTLCGGHNLDPRAFAKVCSVDLKKDEPGLMRFCQDARLPLVTYSAETLASVRVEFASSDFVRQTTGVDNVCERSAVLGSGGCLRVCRTVLEGVAMAVGEIPYEVDFFFSSTKGSDE